MDQRNQVNGQDLGAWLQNLRLRKGLPSAAAFGRAAGIGASHVAMLERSLVFPRWSTALKIADALHLTRSEKTEFYRRIEEARRTADAAEILGDTGQDDSAAADGGAMRAMEVAG
jgi:transcriptional regulator with XRE-family HTH domain